MLEEIEVYSDETKEDISIYSYIKGSSEDIEKYRNDCISFVGGAGLSKGSDISSQNQLARAESLLELLEKSSLGVILVLSNTKALNEATKSWVQLSRKCLENMPGSAQLSEVQKTVVSQRCTQLLPFFAAMDPNDLRLVSFYPDNTGKWIDHQNSIIKISSPELKACCDVTLKTFVAMNARATARLFTHAHGKEIPEIQLLEPQTEAHEILICIVDYLANFSLNYLRLAAGCIVSDRQEEKASIIGRLFPKLGDSALLKFFVEVDGKLEFDTTDGNSRYVTELKIL